MRRLPVGRASGASLWPGQGVVRLLQFAKAGARGGAPVLTPRRRTC